MKLKKVKTDIEEAAPPAPQAEIIEADLYKRSYFGPDVPTLELECWEEELSEAQLQAYKHAGDEYNNIQNKLDVMVKDTGGQVVYNGNQFTAYQLLGKQPVLKDLERQSADIIRSRSRSLSVVKEVKENTRSKRGGRPKRYNENVRDLSPSPERIKTPEPRHKKKKKDKEKKKEEKMKKEDEPKKNADTKTKDKTLAPSNVHSVVTNVRPSEATAVGGLLTGSATKATAIVDLTREDQSNKNIADSREVSFNKLQGKTFPSLVVVARPYLRSKEAPPPSDRAALDGKVKSVLIHTPMKFTEWLIQQGLVRSEQWCAIHAGNKLKLGMYSDVSKFPYSGGYVWISECCPTRFVSVFSSSIFEGATFPPSVILKLVYHWACQTNVQNVVQWVKVDNLYVKGLFTWLRAVCTSAIHNHMGLLGGSGKKIEVGVISLGTTSHDGTQRQVKVEVLGVLDPVEKVIRLRAVEPLAEYEKNYKKRFQKILEPLTGWVHPSSVILTDLTVDKGTLISMGFKTVHQSSSHSDQPAKHSNANIMEYLRRIVPRMFQNTLSLLSRQIIQQFLDELVWREKFGISPGQAFDNIVSHIAEQTKLDAKDPITIRLNKIASNPFKSWKFPSKKSSKTEEAPEPEVRGKRSRKKKDPSPAPPPPPKKRKKEKTTYLDEDDDEEVPLALRRTKIKQEKTKVEKDPEPPAAPRGRRKIVRSYVDDDLDDIPLKNIKKEIKPEETVSLERFYYGQTKENDEDNVAIAVLCPICDVEFNESLLLMEHIFKHLVPPPAGATEDAPQCRYCLVRFATEAELTTHLNGTHPIGTKAPDLFTYACLICEVIPIYEDGDELTSNVLLYVDHLKQHQDKELEVKCNRCVLKFVHLGQLKEHQIRDHNSVEDAIPLCSEEHLINQPKNKARPPVKDSANHNISETYEGLTLVLPSGALCRECDTPLDGDKHFLGRTACSKCCFATSCYRGMLRHSGYCAGPHSLETAARRAHTRLYCVCGYATDIGTDMLSHLLVTGHSSAYSSEEDARANTVGVEPFANKTPDENVEPVVESLPAAIADYAPPSVINTNLSLDDLAPPSVLQSDQHDQELLKDTYDRPLATPRHEEPHYTLGDFEPLPQEPPPQPDFEQL
ncbi:jg23581 [Pararge aegeria aegeria]|uniref:Jg23581 protein n=1 Tax=Pararge aegeria aegeria TaxID=348720 RepID=A0A8S4RMP8_9NEOP|nr:jg23581 [Pararge aegeria aegeria]